MNIYKISSGLRDWDTYDSAIVVARDESVAARIHPSRFVSPDEAWWLDKMMDDWVRPRDVTVTLVGKADEGIPEKTVLCASFNAG